MKLYKFWVKQTGKLTVDNYTFDAQFYGKSDSSVEDAKRDAGEQAKAVQRRIDGKAESRESYDVPIREEIVHRIDDRNLITRNRYGALVLNTENVMFVDIDKPRFGFFETLFNKPSGSAKEQMVAMVEKRAAKSAYRNLGFRLYETQAGVRVIVQGFKTSPVDKNVMKLMADFNADPLYALLCEKQQCYRARLTPKPSRIKCKAQKLIFPRTEAEETAHRAWVERYEQCAHGFSVCKHIKDLGRFREESVIRYHDTQTGAREPRPLA